MHFFFLAAGVLAAAAAILWAAQAFGRRDGGEAREAAERELRLDGIEALGAAAEALAELMEHPALGGPGFITVRFPPPLAADGTAEAAAQYPNIREALYRRVLRQELETEELRAEGAPEALLALDPCFETESGGPAGGAGRAGGGPAGAVPGAVGAVRRRRAAAGSRPGGKGGLSGGRRVSGARRIN